MTPELIADRLTDAQKQALVKAAELLDHFAGEDAGMEAPEWLGCGKHVWAVDVVMDLAECFGIAWDGEKSLGLAVRDALVRKDG